MRKKSPRLQSLLASAILALFAAHSHAGSGTGTLLEAGPTCLSDAAQDTPLLASLREREVPTTSVIRVDVSQAQLAIPLPEGERKVRVGVVKADGTEVDFAGLRPRDLTRTPRAHAQGAVRGAVSNLEKIALSAIGELNRETVRPVSAAQILAFVKKERIRYRIDPYSLN